MELLEGLAKRARVQPALGRDLKHRGKTFEGQWSSKKMTKAGKSTSTSRTRKSVPDVDAYIAAAPAAVQPQLRKLRAMIRAEAPQATEKVSYGIPFYEYGDKPSTFHFATADRRGRVRESHSGVVRAANGTRACRRSHPRVRGPPHARP